MSRQVNGCAGRSQPKPRGYRARNDLLWHAAATSAAHRQGGDIVLTKMASCLTIRESSLHAGRFQEEYFHGGCGPEERGQAVRQEHRGPQRQPGHQGPRVRRARRPLRVWQIHHAAHDRRPGRGDLRRNPHRWKTHERRPAEGPGYRHGIPELRAVSPHDGI